MCVNKANGCLGYSFSLNGVINNGLWPSVPVPVGNATLVVSRHVHGNNLPRVAASTPWALLQLLLLVVLLVL
jgi:hypothetical protein